MCVCVKEIVKRRRGGGRALSKVQSLPHTQKDTGGGGGNLQCARLGEWVIKKAGMGGDQKE